MRENRPQFDASQDRLRASGENKLKISAEKNIAQLEKEIEQHKTKRPSLEMSGTDVGPDSEYEEALQRMYWELGVLQEKRANAESNLSGFVEGTVSENEVEGLRDEANFTNVQVTIREAVFKAMGYADANSGKVMERLYGLVQKASFLEMFNQILKNSVDANISKELMSSKAQGVLKTYYDSRAKK